jgi:lantibiotic biosynthesis protein
MQNAFCFYLLSTHQNITMWKSLCSDIDLNDQLKSKLTGIAKEVATKLEIENHTWHAGNAGIALFYSHLAKLNGNTEYAEKAIDLIDMATGALERQLLTHTFSTGLVGIAWTYHFLIKEGLIGADPNEVFAELDEYIFKITEVNFDQRSYDFLHGGLGGGVYFLGRFSDNPQVGDKLAKIVSYLDKLAEQDAAGYKWATKGRNSEGGPVIEYNLGLSHGIPSIICFLAKCLQLGVERENCKRLIQGAASFILSNQLEKGSGSVFPATIREGVKPATSKLAWCYGDLGVGLSLLLAANAIKDNSLKHIAMTILLASAARKQSELEGGSIKDAGLCHGTAGISHIFNRLFHETGALEFEDAATFWMKETVSMSMHQDGVSGFKYFTPGHGYSAGNGLLVGASGVGLSIISYIGDIEPRWDRSLLLS